MALIKGNNLSLTYEGASSRSLDAVSFSIERSSFTFFLGKSGSGKTSLLKCLAHLSEEYSGEVTYNGTCLKQISRTERTQTLGYVAQQFHLFEHFSVEKNCIHPQVTVLGKEREAARTKAEKHLKQLGLYGLKEKHPHQLSGGQQQRVAIARALCMESSVLLLDEPTSALDPESTQELKEILLSLQKEGMTIVVITHDTSFVKGVLEETTPKIYILSGGKIVETFDSSDAPLEEEHPVHTFINQ